MAETEDHTEGTEVLKLLAVYCDAFTRVQKVRSFLGLRGFVEEVELLAEDYAQGGQ